MFAEFIQVKRSITELSPIFVGSLAGFPISSSTLFGLLVILIIMLAVIQVRKFRAQSSTPSSFQILMEMAYETTYTLIRQVAGSDMVTKVIFPVTGTIFIYILLSNLLGAFPGLGAFTLDGVPLFRITTGDINTTLPLAAISILIIYAYTIKLRGFKVIADGIFHYSDIVASLKKGFRGIGQLVMDLFMMFLDVIGEFAKILSMSLRLFGNMFAGDVLMTILLGIFAFVIPSLWLGMSLLSAVVQTIVFTSLVSIFFSLNLSGISEDTT